MIGGLVLGYFAEGFYQLLFLFIFGGVIPMHNSTLMIATGVGVKNTIDLSGTVKYALDTISMLTIIEVGFYLVVLGIAVLGEQVPASRFISFTVIWLALVIYSVDVLRQHHRRLTLG